MRHILIGLVIGAVTIGISIFVLSETDDAYVEESEPSKSIVMGEAYEGENYTIQAEAFECGTYTPADTTQITDGCVLSIELTNTTSFEQIFNLDGDIAITKDETEYESSDKLSKSLVSDNGLAGEVESGETVIGGVFFEMPVDSDVDRVEVYESVNTDPIVIAL